MTILKNKILLVIALLSLLIYLILPQIICIPCTRGLIIFAIVSSYTLVLMAIATVGVIRIMKNKLTSNINHD